MHGRKFQKYISNNVNVNDTKFPWNIFDYFVFIFFSSFYCISRYIWLARSLVFFMSSLKNFLIRSFNKFIFLFLFFFFMLWLKLIFYLKHSKYNTFFSYSLIFNIFLFLLFYDNIDPQLMNVAPNQFLPTINWIRWDSNEILDCQPCNQCSTIWLIIISILSVTCLFINE